MSMLAFVTLLPTTALPAVREAATPKRSLFGKPKDVFHGVLKQHGRALGGSGFSGSALVALLLFLDEKRGIDLKKSQFDELATFLCKQRQAS